MNKTVNFPKAGIITIINGPGGQDELTILVVSERLYNMCRTAQDRVKPFDPYIASSNIMGLLYTDGVLVREVLEYSHVMSYGEYPVAYLNKYEFVGMIPIETY